MRFRVVGLLAVVAGLVGSNSDSLGAIATSFSLPQTPFSGGLINGVDGFDFTPRTTLVVTGLGWYDHNGDGLLHSHPVGIYRTDTQTLVAPAATVTSASVLDPGTHFRFVDVPSFQLLAGVTYTLSGYGEGPSFDPYVFDPAGGTVLGGGFDFVRARSGAASGLIFAGSVSQDGVIQDVFFGPNFRYVVPEPSGMATAFGVMACVSLLSRRR